MTSSLPAGLLGARRPRVCNFPESSTSAGDEAIELAASAGLILDPWQADVLRGALGERQDGKWSATTVGLIVARQNGKGAILEARELAGLLLFGEQMIMHTAHEMKTAMEAFRRIEQWFSDCDDLRRRVKRVDHSNGQEGIELVNGARLRFVARSKGSGRGFSGDTVILDEAYALEDKQVEALMPTMSARPNPQIWYTSSPALDVDSGLPLWRVRERGSQADGRLAYFDFGCEEGVDLDDPQVWAASNPALGIRISEEFIQNERDTMSDIGFARERLCVWPSEDDTSGPIDMRQWAELTDSDSQAVGQVVFSVDAAPDQSSAAIAVAGQRDDDLMHVEIVDHRLRTGWIVKRLKELTDKWNGIVRLDPGGPAGFLLPDLQEAGIEPELVKVREIGQASGFFFTSVAESTVRHLGQPELNDAVRGAQTRPLGEAWAWSRKDSKTDVCPLVAATLALHGAAEHASDDDGPPNLW